MSGDIDRFPSGDGGLGHDDLVNSRKAGPINEIPRSESVPPSHSKENSREVVESRLYCGIVSRNAQRPVSLMNMC